MKYRVVYHPSYGYKAEWQDCNEQWFNVHSGYYQAVDACKEEIVRHKKNTPRVVWESES